MMQGSKISIHGVEGELKSLNRNLKNLSKMLETLVEAVGGAVELRPPAKGGPLDVRTVFNLPDRLRKTAMAIAKLGEGTATQIAAETGRVRAVESDYLNQLVEMGYVKKRRVARSAVFYTER